MEKTHRNEKDKKKLIRIKNERRKGEKRRRKDAKERRKTKVERMSTRKGEGVI
jgi:hypothetical protein